MEENNHPKQKFGITCIKSMKLYDMDRNLMADITPKEEVEFRVELTDSNKYTRSATDIVRDIHASFRSKKSGETHKIHNDIFSNDTYRFKKLVNLDDWAAGSNGKGMIVEGRVSCITSRGINIDYQQTTLFVKWKNVYYIEKNR